MFVVGGRQGLELEFVEIGFQVFVEIGVSRIITRAINAHSY